MTIDLTAGLNPQQKQAVLATKGPVLVTAGAGSGKTRVLTRRIAYLVQQGVAPRNILAITFTRKAANEMQERIAKLVGSHAATEMMIGTFHAVCAQILRSNGQQLANVPVGFTVADQDAQTRAIKWALKQLQITPESLHTKDQPRKIVRNVMTMIGWAKDELKGPIQFNIVARKHHNWSVEMGTTLVQAMPDIYAKYEERLARDHTLDFNDLIMKVVEGFKARPELLNMYQNRWQYLSVDEYQDTNQAQYQLIRQLAAKYQNLCVVGDADQSIYAWRGADIQNILDFKQDYPQATEIKLEQNYRSTKNILQNANHLIEDNTQRLDKNLWTQNDMGDSTVVCEAGTPSDEVDWVVNQIKALHAQGTPYEEIAIMYRANWIARGFDQALTRNGIPHQIISGQGFYDQFVIKNLLAYWSLIVNPADSDALQRVINYPRRGIGSATVTKLVNHADDQAQTALFTATRADQIGDLAKSRVSAVQQFGKIMQGLQDIAQHTTGTMGVNTLWKAMEHDLDFASWTDDGDKTNDEVQANLREAWQGLIEFTNQTPAVSQASVRQILQAFLQNVNLMAQQDRIDDDPHAVQLMTIHAAKGLEFEAVFVVRMNEGTFPNSHVKTQAGMEEERRLAYVAFTRAKKHLYISFVDTAGGYGGYDDKNGLPSIFISELDPTAVKHTASGYRSSGYSFGF